MKYKTFAEYLQKLENTPKRLEMTDILCELIQLLDQEEVDKALYLSQGYLKAPFDSPKFNMAEKMIMRAIAEAYSVSAESVEVTFKTLGDLGSTAQETAKNINGKGLSINEVQAKLLEIAEIGGEGSQEQKVTETAKLLNQLEPLGAKFVVRTILGTARLGFTELTIIDALTLMLTKDKVEKKKIKTQIEHKYNIRPDIGLLAKKIKQGGLSKLSSIHMEPGIPIKAQKPSRVENMQEAMERIEKLWAEFKLDGTRVFLHLKSDGTVKTFTRNLEETSHMYPDLIEGARRQVDAKSVILDGEAIGFDKLTSKYLPFQETIQRKRKHGVQKLIDQIPLKYIVFDILYKDGEEILTKPLSERNKILQKTIKPGKTIEVSAHVETDSMDKLKEYFAESKAKNLEGLIVKNPKDAYQAGARTYSWIKLKHADDKMLDDAVDCVILGYYKGQGVRTQFGVGGILVGVMDKDALKTITKVGTGLTEDTLTYLKSELDKIAIKEAPKNLEINKKFIPDVYVQPKIVVEIGADEISVSQDHSAGYALRFPRLLRFRDDKNLSEITSLTEIKSMYKKQRK